MSFSKTRKIKIDPLDKKWAKFVRERDGACEVCGKTEYLAAHHFIRRGISSTRYDLDNGITLCPSHHTFNYEFSAHRTPEAFDRWFKNKYPERYKYLKQQAKVIMSRLKAQAEFRENYNL
jgi:hypothetical protein